MLIFRDLSYLGRNLGSFIYVSSHCMFIADSRHAKFGIGGHFGYDSKRADTMSQIVAAAAVNRKLTCNGNISKVSMILVESGV